MAYPNLAPNPGDSQAELPERYRSVRALSVAIAAPLSDADATVQPMDDASPIKWHLAHTTWFLETFVLGPHVPGYRPFDPRFAYLFNSYYEAEGPRHPRPRRGMLSRPSLETVLNWRDIVDQALLDALPGLPPAALSLVTLGLSHEEQHQELMLTDILCLFAANPLLPVYGEHRDPALHSLPEPLRWIAGREGIVEIGDEGGRFAFDCEGPRHGTLLHPHALADRPVSNGEWQDFIAEDGYGRADLWLADGWAWVNANAIDAPLYWQSHDEHWLSFGLDGVKPIDPAAPVTHISHYEADAFARWAGARLPTEAEWESAAQALDPSQGNLLDGASAVRPGSVGPTNGLVQMFGDVWEWTASAFSPYPGFRPASGAIGEYNGKFMSGQHVLRGGSCATPRGHVRASYRNFFYPHQRWQFTGLRLARDL